LRRVETRRLRKREQRVTAREKARGLSQRKRRVTGELARNPEHQILFGTVEKWRIGVVVERAAVIEAYAGVFPTLDARHAAAQFNSYRALVRHVTGRTDCNAGQS
jgi:hypothetical protein